MNYVVGGVLALAVCSPLYVAASVLRLSRWGGVALLLAGALACVYVVVAYNDRLDQIVGQL